MQSEKINNYTKTGQDGETGRISALYQFQILDTAPEEDFDDIVALAAEICQCPIASISLVDEKRVWLKSKLGVDFNEIPREVTFCANINDHQELLVINDLAEDVNHRNNPMVIGGPNIRFLASTPIITKEGYTIGYLCVMDQQPKSISQNQCTSLKRLGKQVMHLLNLRLEIINLRQKAQELKNSGEQIDTIFQNAIDAVMLVDHSGKIVKWNPKSEIIFGWNAKEAIGKNFLKTLIPGKHHETILDEIKFYESPGEEAIKNATIELSAYRKDNTEFDIALGISPTLINGNQFFICFISDITDRKLVTAKLDKQKEFYETILNKIPTDIAVFDAQHKYLFVNPGAVKDEDLRKYIIGKDDFEYARHRNWPMEIAKRRREKFIEAKNTKKEIRWEDYVIDKDGNKITHLRRFFPIFNEAGEHTMVIGFGIDISDRKVLEEKQGELVKQLSGQNTQLIDFCNIVSHNLRAPLVNMSMLVKFIEESNDQEEQKNMISMLNPVIESLHTTFNELVESIQIKQNIEVKSENVLLSEYLSRTLNTFDLDIKNTKAEVESDFENAPVVNFPPKYLLSIFHNLISNSIKYHSLKRKPLIRIKSESTEESIVLSFNDNGLGIDLEKHGKNIFKIGKVFHRHPNSKGFGLYMTKTQVQAMGGKIWVESTLDSGTTFFIEFKNQNKCR